MFLGSYVDNFKENVVILELLVFGVDGFYGEVCFLLCFR